MGYDWSSINYAHFSISAHYFAHLFTLSEYYDLWVFDGEEKKWGIGYSTVKIEKRSKRLEN